MTVVVRSCLEHDLIHEIQQGHSFFSKNSFIVDQSGMGKSGQRFSGRSPL